MPRIEEYSTTTVEPIITSHKTTVLGPRSVNDANIVEMVKRRKRKKIKMEEISRYVIVIYLENMYQIVVTTLDFEVEYRHESILERSESLEFC